MGRLKQPLLSFEAHGTIGDHLTYQRTKGKDSLRTKPVPSNPNTLLQQYHRWRYQDAIWYWLTLTSTQKAAYRTLGSRNHMTAFAACTSVYLDTLPDLVVELHLDTKIGTTTPDTSRNARTCTVYGAYPTAGIIDKAFYFDGIDDRIDLGTGIDLTDALSVEAWIQTPPALLPDMGISCKEDYKEPFFLASSGTILRFYLSKTGAAWDYITAWNGLLPSTQYHIVGIFNKNTGAKLFVNGILRYSSAVTGAIRSLPLTHTWVGTRWYGTYGDEWKGLIDEYRLYSRDISADQILQHSLRRYPR